MSRSDAAFAPPGTAWTPVSPRLATLRRLLVLAVVLLIAAPTAVMVFFVALWTVLVVLVVAAVAAVLGWRWVRRNVAAWGYAERDDDLLIRHGVLYRQLVVGAYGRMQFVDVTAGPLDRRFGSRLGAAAHGIGVDRCPRIPGLDPEEAARLRYRLASRGEARAAGL